MEAENTMTPKVKISGTHVTVKEELPDARILSSIRPPQPEKGAHNPPHLQTNISKWFAKITKG
jgi:hypothetical protein